MTRQVEASPVPWVGTAELKQNTGCAVMIKRSLKPTQLLPGPIIKERGRRKTC